MNKTCDECGEEFDGSGWKLYQDNWMPIEHLIFCSEWCRDAYKESDDVYAASLLSPSALGDAAREAQLLDGDYIEYD